MVAVLAAIYLLNSFLCHSMTCDSLAITSLPTLHDKQLRNEKIYQIQLNDTVNHTQDKIKRETNDEIKDAFFSENIYPLTSDSIQRGYLFRQSSNRQDKSNDTSSSTDYVATTQMDTQLSRLPSVTVNTYQSTDVSSVDVKRQNEMASLYAYRGISNHSNGTKVSFISSLAPDVPRHVDWRERGVISPVINQGKCGACWAYSSIETIESMSVIYNVTRNITKLSAQQLIDCGTSASPTTLNGCDGGDTCAVLSWLKTYNVKIVTETEYPSRSSSGPCLLTSTDHGVIVNNYQCKNFVGREDEMIRLLANHGPLTATVDATTWPFYLGGVIKFNCEVGKTHAVQIVGYNLNHDTPYYIVKNSWGPEFGLDGYLHIAIGNNLCGIAEDVSSIDVTA